MSRKNRDKNAANRPPTINLNAVRLEIAKLELKPGDSLLVRVPPGVPMEQKARIADSIKRQLSVPVLIYSPEIEIAILQAGQQPPAGAVGAQP